MSRRPLILFLLLMLFPALALARTVTVTQGETVTLNLKVVNTGAEAIIGLEDPFDSNPRHTSTTSPLPSGNQQVGWVEKPNTQNAEICRM